MVACIYQAQCKDASSVSSSELGLMCGMCLCILPSKGFCSTSPCPKMVVEGNFQKKTTTTKRQKIVTCCYTWNIRLRLYTVFENAKAVIDSEVFIPSILLIIIIVYNWFIVFVGQL